MPQHPRDSLIVRLRRRFATQGLRAHLLGLLLRPRVQRAGIITVMAGWGLPTIDNRGGRLEIGNCALYQGVRLEVWAGATLTIGTGTYLNRNTEVVAAQSVSIGRDCMIARDVLIMDTDQHALPGADLAVAPVAIEDRVWIGARAIILKGVRIGHDSVIGAGAIVTRSVPPHSVVVVPAARVIRSTEPPASVEDALTPRPPRPQAGEGEPRGRTGFSSSVVSRRGMDTSDEAAAPADAAPAAADPGGVTEATGATEGGHDQPGQSGTGRA